ncbi:MAG: type II toxin-antitoxin system VapC family toxin [Gammaproteobacteria bacterium]|nr:type II toxin-antitoxin system VapC family toxin [Gammaproteobacteria bacterium]
MKQKVYIETSVVSYFTAKTSKDLVVAGHQVSTVDMWNNLDSFQVFISDIVIQEASKGNPEQAKLRLDALEAFQILELDDEAKELARALIVGKAIPEKSLEDALHIAVATANGIDVIVTWNFSHINNPFTRRLIRQVIESKGYVCPEICSPEELIGEDT